MFILCQGDLAKEPYIIPISEVPVYSLEELCYYMYHNIYTVTEEFFDENLVHWLKGQVHLRTLAMKMEKLIRKHHNIKDLVVTLLCACDYYKKEEIFSLVEVMEKIANLPPEKKARMKADNYLKAGRYGRSFQEYQSLLHGPLAKELSTKEYGDVLHDQAIAMFHVSSFRQAADGFKEAYARNHRPESLQQYLYDLITMATSMRDASGNLSGGLESLEVVASDNIRSATIVVSTVPILILYPFLQKYFVKGVTVGSVKG